MPASTYFSKPKYAMNGDGIVVKADYLPLDNAQNIYSEKIYFLTEYNTFVASCNLSDLNPLKPCHRKSCYSQERICGKPTFRRCWSSIRLRKHASPGVYRTQNVKNIIFYESSINTCALSIFVSTANINVSGKRANRCNLNIGKPLILFLWIAIYSKLWGHAILWPLERGHHGVTSLKLTEAS